MKKQDKGTIVFSRIEFDELLNEFVGYWFVGERYGSASFITEPEASEYCKQQIRKTIIENGHTSIQIGGTNDRSLGLLRIQTKNGKDRNHEI